MWDRIRDAGRTAWLVVGICALLAVVGVVIWFFRVLVPPLVIASAIVFVLNPVVTGLQRRGVPRVFGTLLAYLMVLAILAGIVGLIVPVALASNDIGDEFSNLGDDLEEWWNEQSEKSIEEDWFIQLPSWEELSDDLSGNNNDRGLADSLSRLRDIAGSVFEALLIAVIAPIIAAYILVDLPHIRAVTESLIPEGARAEVQVVARRLNRSIGGFFRGQLIVALIVGIMSAVGLWIVGLPFWLIIGMIAGLFNLVPLIGPWIGGALGVAVAFAAGDGLSQAIWVAVVMIIAQQIDNHFISPMVMHRTVRLHPAAVILALLAGGTIFGFLGLFLAVPAAAIFKILGSHLWRTYVLGQSPEEIAAIWDELDTEPAVGVIGKVGDQESATPRRPLGRRPPPPDGTGDGS